MEQTLQRRLEIGFALFLLVLLLLFFVIGLSYPPRPRELPLLVDGVGIVLVLIQLVHVIRKPAVPGKTVGAPWNWKAVFISFGSMAVYLLATLVFGMVLSSAIIIYGSGMAFGAKSKVKMALVTVATVIVIYLLFVVALQVPLYPGLLGDWMD